MASNLRALVSNLGDGNWGIVGTANADDNKIDATNRVIYFPPGSAKGVAPSAGTHSLAPGSLSGNLTGWTSKTQWMVQVVTANLGTGGTPDVKVYVGRPTGVEELVLTITSTGTDSYGGFDDEAIQGPVAYFKFISDSTGGTPDVRCYVIGWNYGDISDGLATR
tara:strand:- start:450 stop:941 length:492 start_codon:yes stop_codon:yes gene_type:complete